jgi:NAD(P)-dependent dehydrogenase (short-subunit alcohol dehydrogenase family)
MDIKNKVILITGAGKGRGRFLADALSKHGAIIAANDISPMNVEDVVKKINESGGKAKSYIEDVAKKVGAQALIKTVEDDFGRIDILINHASVQPQVGLLKMDEWDWHRVLDVNMTGAFLMMQSVGRVMKEQGSGLMITLIAETGNISSKEAGAYFASQAGLRELSNQMNVELSPYQVKVVAFEDTNQVLSLLEVG